MKIRNIILFLLISFLISGLWLAFGDKNLFRSGYNIAVINGSGLAKKFKDYRNVKEVLTYDDNNQALSDITKGKVDAAIMDRVMGLYLIKKAGYSGIRMAGDLINKEYLAVAFPKEDKALRQAINKALSEIIKNGTYAEISKKYFGRDILKGRTINVTYKDEPIATDGSWARVKKMGRICFAMSGIYPPFDYFNDNNELVGFNVEIAKEVCAVLNVKYEPVITGRNTIEGLKTKRYDAIWDNLIIREDLMDIVEFSDPYCVSGAQLFVRRDSTITGLKSLETILFRSIVHI